MTESADEERPSGGGRRGKVSRLIDRYGLDSVGDELESRWTAVGEDHRSLRDLADDFNKAIFREALGREGVQTIGGEVENIYRLLTDDGVNRADRMRATRRLEQDGLDADAIQREFVSYQAIRTYLNEERGVEYDPGEADQIAKEGRNIQKFQGRMEAVTLDKIEHLRKSDRLEIGDPNVFVDIRVVCSDCGEQYEATELLRAGGCGCSADGG